MFKNFFGVFFTLTVVLTLVPAVGHRAVDRNARCRCERRMASRTSPATSPFAP